jgi:hypothetical protein
MAKAYDRVDWGFLEGVLAKLGYHSRWIRWVMARVTTVWYSVRFNGNILDSFSPTRGLRQGDGLSTLIKREIENVSLRKLFICRRGPRISHLLLVDDCLMFFERNVQQAAMVKSILDRYEEGT